MALNRTRKLFIDVARQLFAKVGFEGTTMNRIAEAAQKGRRTLYTYFKSKEELLSAVIAEELENLYEELKGFVDRPIPADEKLMKFVYRRLEAVHEVVQRNGSLNAEFFKDITLLERTRVRFDMKETRLIQRILSDGVREGRFNIIDTSFTAMLLHNAFKGLEVPYIRGQLGRTKTEQVERFMIVRQLIIDGIAREKS